MKIVRFRLTPASTWVTPWQSDTLMGEAACVYGREHGVERLEADLLEPWRTGQPPFVFSDGFPGDLLPAPACLGLWPWHDKERKAVKRTAWLTKGQFRELQAGRQPRLEGDVVKPFRELLRMRNALDRSSDTVEPGGTLYGVPAEAFDEDFPDKYLSIYAAIEEGRIEFVGELLELLARQGFGADAAVGQGQFELMNGWEDADWLANGDSVSGWTSLSTFQPAPKDPTEGYWRSFVKYGRLGPDLDVEVFKRPQWMLRAGACFHSQERRDWYGRWIGTDELLPTGTTYALAARGVRPGQAAFALGVPIVWAGVYDG